MVSIFTFLPEPSADAVEPRTVPHLAVGAASPLWLMFGGAAAAGAAYWWWASRWRETINLEAMMALTPEPVAPPVDSVAAFESAPAAEVAPPVLASADAVLEAVETGLDAAEAVAETTVEVTETAAEDLAQAMVAPVEAAEPAAVDPIVADVVAEVLAKAEETADDLTRLVGVGPRLAASLAELGVTRFSQIAAWTPEDLASFDQLLNLKGRAERDAWVAQAQRFATQA